MQLRRSHVRPPEPEPEPEPELEPEPANPNPNPNPNQVLRPDLARVFSGRFRSMAGMCPEASYLPEGSVVCCGNTSYRQRWCGPQRRHQHACRQAWRSLQPALQTLNRTLLMANLPPPAMRAVNRYNRNHRTEQNY